MARKMKDSGIEWIGQIPEDWQKAKMKQAGQYVNGYAFKPDDWSSKGKPIIRIQDLTGSNRNPNYYDGDIDTKYLIKKGDILVSWAATLDAFIWQGNDGWLNQHIFKAVPDEKIIKYDFFFWLMKIAMENMNNDNKHGIVMQHVTTEVFGNFGIPLPPLNEQQKIANFLDEKVGEIDTIIVKTKESIEEYKKYKQALITEAITNGLDKSVTTINTNNIHIPKIPAHWQMKKIKYIFEIKKDIAGKEGYDILSITQKGIKIKDISKNEGQLAQDYSNYQLVDIGDFAMNHMDLLTGWVDVSQYAGVTSPDYRVFRFIDADKYNTEYYLYLMQMCYMDKIFYGLGQGVSNLGRWRLQADKFLNFTIPEPPLDEQERIAEYLSKKCGEIDALIAKKEAFIEEMENYKKSLIYEYVTGKKEVPS